MSNAEPKRERPGATLLETLIVIGILGLLLQLLLPAVQGLRESARQLQCAAHLRRLASAIRDHHDLQQRYPSGGWHFTWIGEPERGTGRSQPGSWAFNLLSDLGEDRIRRLGIGTTGLDRSRALVSRCRKAPSVFNCPTRRGWRSYPQTWNQQPLSQGGPLREPIVWAAKSDYAACSGDGERVEFDWRWTGPSSLAEGDDSRFVWPDSKSFTGVIFGRSEIRDRQIRDGLAQTYLLGEKYVNPRTYDTGEDWGDNENLYAGFNNDNSRSSGHPPRRDRPAVDWRNAFGSAAPEQLARRDVRRIRPRPSLRY